MRALRMMAPASAALAAASLVACTAPLPRPGVLLENETRVRGRVAVLGAEPATQVVVRPEDGPVLQVEGDARARMERVDGTTVEVAGVVDEDAGTIDARMFVVVEVDGLAATDGVLFRDEEGFGLVDHAGETHRLERLPAALQRLVGARVWVTGGLDMPQAWGVIIPAP